MDKAEIKKLRDEHPLRKKLAEMGISPSNLATACDVPVTSISKSLGGYQPVPKKIREWLEIQGVDMQKLDSDIDAWRETFSNAIIKKVD